MYCSLFKNIHFNLTMHNHNAIHIDSIMKKLLLALNRKEHSLITPNWGDCMEQQNMHIFHF